MSLHDSISRVMRPLHFGLPGTALLQAAIRRVADRWPDIIPDVQERNREIVVAKFAQRFRTGQWQGTRLSAVTAVARILFEDGWRQRREHDALREFLIDETKASNRGGLLSAMASIYLHSYEPGASHSIQLGGALHQSRRYLGSRWQRLLKAVPDLFECDLAHESVAQAMLDMPDPYAGLRSMGFMAPHAPGFVDHVHFAFIDLLRDDLDDKQGLDQLFAWLKPSNGPARESGAPEAIEAILSPWMQDEPGEDLQKHIVENLIGMYGDPRVVRGGTWSVVREASRAVLIRWLTGQNINFFLDVVSRVNQSHMWPERRKFWMGLHKQGRIEAAWVAFSPQAVEEAKSISRRLGAGQTLAFGSQVGTGYDSDRSLLILKIGNRIVVDGSHNFKVHIFRANDPNAPRLFQDRYDGGRIRKTLGAEAFAHLGYWQGKVLERI